VWGKLRNAKNKDIDAYLDRLQLGREFSYAPKENAEFYGPNKARYIDPIVLQDGKFRKTSELISGLAEYIKVFKHKCQYIGVTQQASGAPKKS
jgi:hypothetical protein